MLKLKGNIIEYENGIALAVINYFDEHITLTMNDNPITESELSDLIEILQIIENKISSN